MSKTTTNRKLTLNLESLRVLTADELERAAGGEGDAPGVTPGGLRPTLPMDCYPTRRDLCTSV